MVPKKIKDNIEILMDPKDKALHELKEWVKEKEKEQSDNQKDISATNQLMEARASGYIHDVWIPEWRKHPWFGDETSSPLTDIYEIKASQVFCKDDGIHFTLTVKLIGEKDWDINFGVYVTTPKAFYRSMAFALRCKKLEKKEQLMRQVSKKLVEKFNLATGEFLLPNWTYKEGDPRRGRSSFSVNKYLDFIIPYPDKVTELKNRLEKLKKKRETLENDMKDFHKILPDCVRDLMATGYGRRMIGFPPFMLPFGV